MPYPHPVQIGFCGQGSKMASVAFVYLLWHVHRFKDGTEDTKLIGVYSTRDKAVAARHRKLKYPGFRKHPRGFTIDRYELDTDAWSEGFITVK